MKGSTACPVRCIVTCEHASNAVPMDYRRVFRGQSAVLKSHRGWDPGAFPIAEMLSSKLGVRLHTGSVTRLLVELNRSIDHPSLFSKYARRLSSNDRRMLLRRYYHPYRNRVEREVCARIERGLIVIHLSVHTFTPVLDGIRRRTDIGLLFDPHREPENRLCRAWRRTLSCAYPAMRVHLNLPYRGTSDGFTTSMRGRFDQAEYLGIEVEVGQQHVTRKQAAAKIGRVLASTLMATIAHTELTYGPLR